MRSSANQPTIDIFTDQYYKLTNIISRKMPNTVSRSTISIIALIFIGIAGLFIPNVYLQGVIILYLGALIYFLERKYGLLVPASPGFIFWFGNFLIYVVGGIGSGFLFNSWDDFGIRYLTSVFKYLGLGLISYIGGILLCGGLLPHGKRKEDITKNIEFSPYSICIFFGIFAGLTAGYYFIKGSYFTQFYYNIIIGPLMSIDKLPAVLLAIYLIRPNPKWWAVLLLLCAPLATAIEGISIGYGRRLIPLAVVATILIWLSLQRKYRFKISRKAMYTIIIAPVVIVFFFAISTNYRERLGLDSSVIAEERLQILRESGALTFSTGNQLIDIVEPLFVRLIEKENMELLNLLETGSIEKVGWTIGDLEQLLLSWVPKIFFPEKGKGYGRDIMEIYGYSDPDNNISVTLLTDAFRRSGVSGVILVYLLIGFASTLFALTLTRHMGSYGTVLVFYFALLHIDYFPDAVGAFTLYLYRLPSSGLVIYAVLRISGILQVRENFPGFVLKPISRIT